MLDGLAFLPEHDVNEGMIFLRSIMPAAAADLVSYFDETYSCMYLGLYEAVDDWYHGSHRPCGMFMQLH
jgi:hypothetical protein